MTSCLNATYVYRSTLFAGAETGLQWLPLRVPGNVRLIVTATHPDPNYLQLHEQKIRQHMMMHPHQGLTSQSSRASSLGDGGETNATTTTTQNDCMGATIQEDVDTKGDGEAEYESSHRRRKVCRPADACRQKDRHTSYGLNSRFLGTFALPSIQRAGSVLWFKPCKVQVVNAAAVVGSTVGRRLVRDLYDMTSPAPKT